MLHRKNNFRLGCAGLALAAGLLGTTSPASAQSTVPDQPPTTGAGPGAQQQDSGPIVITGSRIRRDPLDQPAPVVFVDRADIDRTGLVSVAEVLQRIPSSGGALNSKFNNSGNFGNPPDGGGVGAGAAEVDLRYLGSKRVLVLVDGLRFVNASSASGVPGSTDLNSIPESMIERIEVLQDGASSIYGSDAIAGVVNIITKRGQDGFRASAQYGQYISEGDGETQNYQLSWGNGDSGPTQIVIGGNYVKQEGVSAADRDISQFPTPGATSCLAGGCSSFTPLGRFIVLGENLTLKGPVSGRPRFDPADPTGPNSDFKAFGDADRFNFAPFNFIQVPIERYGGFVTLTQELSPVTTFTLKGIYNRRNSSNQAAPLPLGIGPAVGNGNLLDFITVDASNPFNPFGETLVAGVNYDGIFRRVIEGGPRRYDQKVETYYATATLNGSFNVHEDTLYWDVNAVWGENKANQTVFGNVNADRVRRALGPVAACTGATDGCVPLNLFGGVGSITPEMYDYIGFIQRDRSKQRLWDFSANISGSLFSLPAGPLGVALGYEHRAVKGSFDPDPIIVQGFGSDIPALPTSGSINSDEIYGELSIPLLKDMTFFDQLDVQLAARFSDYSTSGSNATFKASVNWKPIEDLLFRGSWAEGFRAPSIGELFGTPSRFDQEVADPCATSTTTGQNFNNNATVRSNCILQGVPATGATQPNPQISVVTGGNEELDAETSESWVFGAVYSPSFIPRLSLEANYFDIQVDGAIQAIAAGTLLNRCALTNDPLSCAAISRTGSGSVSQISGLLQNIAGIETNGLDVTLNYRTPETGAGTFGLFWTNTFLFNYTVIVPATEGVTEIEREGTEQGSPDQAFPKYKATGIFDWTLGDFGASLTGRYISSVKESEADDNKLGSRFYTDIQLRWTPGFWGERFGVAVGVNNLFDKDPPPCISCGLNNMDPTTYDVPGQFGYVRVSVKM
ncbi:TonB-dependent receptor [Sphingomonas sp. LY54]|uniref:TonB-dependent receptor n=1 Tax=Sphingomonas sp. LY54 TaxID=3095343 RepID=UPI002D79BC3E|nr:TonB-dependent receptor [Sphingomonas sp. LY54]WRP29056.1 TonB-dependent receptor [Sphingomonas sp. LY54]